MSGSGSLRVVSFNVQHGRRPDGTVDVDALGRAVALFGADVVGLQEVDVGARRSGGIDMPAAIAAASGMEAVFGQSLVLGCGGRYGNAVLVRGSFDDVAVVPLPARPDGARAEPRTALVVGVEVDGRTLTFGSCHLGLDGAESRRQLVAALGAVAGRPGPRVLVGDGNLSRRHVRPIADRAGFALASAWPTFPSHRPWRRIDHVLTDGLRIVGTQVRRAPVSDHRPLLADLEG